MRAKMNCKDGTKVTYGNVPEIVMDWQAYIDITYAVKEFPGECSFCGMVTPDITKEYSRFVITEVRLPKQENTSAHTEAGEEAMGELVTELVKEGKCTSNLLAHIHSHGTMGVFHSGEDKDNYETLRHGQYLVTLVVNKAGEYKGAVEVYSPCRVTFEDVPVYVNITSLNEEPSEEYKALVKQRIEEDMPKSVIWGGGYVHGFREQEYTRGSWKDSKDTPEKIEKSPAMAEYDVELQDTHANFLFCMQMLEEQLNTGDIELVREDEFIIGYRDKKTGQAFEFDFYQHYEEEPDEPVMGQTEEPDSKKSIQYDEWGCY